MRIKAFEKENNNRYKENKNDMEIMYDPFFVPEETEKSTAGKSRLLAKPTGLSG